MLGLLVTIDFRLRYPDTICNSIHFCTIHLNHLKKQTCQTVLNNCQNVYLFFKVHIVTEWSKFGLHIYDDATNLLEFCDDCLYSMKCSKQDSNLFFCYLCVTSCFKTRFNECMHMLQRPRYMIYKTTLEHTWLLYYYSRYLQPLQKQMKTNTQVFRK